LPVHAAARDIQGVSAELATWIVEIGELRPGADFELDAARLVARRASDRFDGADWPRGVAMLSSVPTLSGVVAVARVWAHLTSRDTGALSHADALAVLSEHAGTRFDPDVVRAARTVVAQEAQFAPLPAFQPRAHGWPGPFAWRRIVAPRLLSHLVAEN
jgi:response regulator RpfG family c-di-GMP phosphodiesterase